MKKLLLLITALITLLSFGLISCDSAPEDCDGDSAVQYCIVTFDSQGGSEVESQTVLKGNPLTRPETPTRDEYSFTGWFTAENTEWSFDTDRANNDITLYAGWSVINNDPTDSLIYKKEGNAYTVIGVGEQTIVVIPAEHDGLPVKKIQGEYGTGAFARKAITSVTIPDSIVEIGQNSFNNCSALSTVIISTNSKLEKIGNNAFSGNHALKEIYIPSGMTNLGDSVFNNCGAIERFIVAEGNTAYKSENGHLIDKSTATLLRGANNKTVPDGVKIIATAAFRKSKITELILPQSIEDIGNYIISDSGVTVIRYLGTQAQWDSVSKAKMWNMGKTDIGVECLPEIDKEICEMYITINGTRLTVKLEKNSAVNELIELLKKGDIVYTADDYGGFEKVGSLGHSITTSNNTKITTQAGDVILYNGNQIVLFYGSNKWSYTRLGKIEYSSIEQLCSALNAGNGATQVTLSLR